MAFSYQEEVSNGVQTVYAIDFDFRDTGSIYVYAGNHSDYATQLSWRFTNFNTQIELTNLTEVPAGTKFYIRRIVDRSNLSYIFENRSMRGKFVDEQNYAALYLTQEIMDGFTTLSVAAPVPINIDMLGNQIKNVGDATDLGDAVNLAQLKKLLVTAGGNAVLTYSSQPEPNANEYEDGQPWVIIDKKEYYTLQEGFWVEDGQTGDDVDITAASYLTLAQAQASDLEVGQYVRLTDRGNGLFKVYHIGTTADGYSSIGLASGLVLVLAEVGVVKFSHLGGVGDGIADDSEALEALVTLQTGARRYIDLEDYKIRITKQISFNEIWVKANGAEIHKDFDGTGLVITGGSYYFRLRGDLAVIGKGDGYADGASETTNGSANGVAIQGCRLDVIGKFESYNHQGNGFFVNCNGNMNRTRAQLYAYNNNVRGIRFTGTQDDCSVWKLDTYTYGNYEGGVYVDDDFQGRQWDWYCYNEASNNPNGLHGVYIGRLRLSDRVSVYSEEQTLTGAELTIGSNCENIKVTDMRLNRSVNNSSETCSLVAGNGGLWEQSNEAYEPSARSVNLIDVADRFIGKKYIGSSSSDIMEERVYGNGVFERRLLSRSTSVNTDFTQGGSLGDSYKHYGVGNPQRTTFSYGGTRVAPTDAAVGNILSERNYAQTGGSLRELTRVNHKLDSISGNKGVSSIEWATTNAELLPSVKMTLQANGVLNIPAGVTPFTGIHIGRSATPIEKGFAVDVVSVTREIAQRLDEEDRSVILEYMTAVPHVSLSSGAMSTVCLGIVDSCTAREDGTFDVYIAAVGDNSTTNITGFIVNNENGDVCAGDLLCTSSTSGVLMKLPSDCGENVVRFKALENANFDSSGNAVVYGHFR